jgi:hypothetical protein
MLPNVSLSTTNKLLAMSTDSELTIYQSAREPLKNEH